MTCLQYTQLKFAPNPPLEPTIIILHPCVDKDDQSLFTMVRFATGLTFRSVFLIRTGYEMMTVNSKGGLAANLSFVAANESNCQLAIELLMLWSL